ncbi:MAG: sigma-70 family RNA polymerase sigma factor [Thermoanaerobaculia bacterium]|nr:sigma-70 family RNA polymerase sigma factor [Thermoanaerobaculia bacterium]
MNWRVFTSSRTSSAGGRQADRLPADVDLVHRIAEQDRQAFETLYRRYYRRLFGFLARWIDQSDVVEEVLDDVLFTVWTDAAKFEGRSRVSTWIFGIAYRQALARLRRTRAEASLDEAPEPWADDIAVERWELRSSLAEALESLSADHRAVLEMTYYDGLSYREIARVLGCPENTVKTRMFYARRHLRSVLPDFGWKSRARAGSEAV